ncbi:unnamed protein product [Scomber scombrus]|uniref:Unnamed protein product n=1 Tax=Scomber scombrus TaxID=13677 RepID=A0AAV1P7H5_SCOSC
MTSPYLYVSVLSHDLRAAAPSDTESAVRRSESQGSRPFRREKACGGSHLSSAQRPNEAVLYREPTRWMEPLHHGCMGAQWKRCTACFFDSQPSPTVLPYGYHQGDVEYS